MDEHIEKDVDRIRVENRVQYLQLVVVECNSNSRKYYAPQPEALSKLHAYIPVQRICFFDGVIVLVIVRQQNTLVTTSSSIDREASLCTSAWY
jgi:hypothetical protein